MLAVGGVGQPRDVTPLTQSSLKFFLAAQGDIDMPEAKRQKVLEDENTKLKPMLADVTARRNQNRPRRKMRTWVQFSKVFLRSLKSAPKAVP